MLGPSPLSWKRASQHGALLQESSPMPTWVPRVYGKHSEKLQPGYLPSTCASVPCCWMATWRHLEGLPSLKRQYTLFPIYSRNGSVLSLCHPRGSSHNCTLCKHYPTLYTALYPAFSHSPWTLCKMGSHPFESLRLSLPWFTSLNLLFDTFSPSNSEDCFLNLQINFLVVQNDFMLY